MHLISLRKLKTISFGAFFLFLVAGFFFIYLPNYTKIKRLRAENKRLQSEIEKLQRETKQLADQRRQIEEGAFVWEDLARRHLGAVKESEIVIDITHNEE